MVWEIDAASSLIGRRSDVERVGKTFGSRVVVGDNVGILGTGGIGSEALRRTSRERSGWFWIYVVRFRRDENNAISASENPLARSC